MSRLEPVGLALCTRRDLPGALGDTYGSARAALGLKQGGGVALVQAQDVAGASWTVISRDVEGVESVLSIEAMGVSCGYTIDPDTVVKVLPGWVVPSTMGLIDRPPPHPPLARPGTVTATRADGDPAPRLRRSLADQIAHELAEPPGFSRAEHLQTMHGDSDPDEPRLVDLLRVRADLSHPVIQDALTGAWRLAAAPGLRRETVRAKISGRTVRMVRATGQAWSLLARPGEHGPAVLLLDDPPGVVIDLAGAERLEELLDALVTVADRS